MRAGSGAPAGLGDACRLLAPLFTRDDARRRATDYVAGLLSGSGRKNARQLAERAGHAGPDGLQWLLNGARWSADALRDVVRDQVRSTFPDPAVLALDATGFAKRGTMSVGVARQFDPRSGRMANCQVAVFAGHVTARGVALVDRELYLPPEWVADAARCARTGVPAGLGHATLSALAARMLRRSVEAGLRPAWVAGDERGDTGELRALCERLALPHMIEVTPGHPVAVAPRRPPLPAAEIAALAPRRGYRRPAAGSDRERAVLHLGVAPETGLVRVLFARRYRSRAHTATYHLGQVPAGTGAAELAAVVDARAALAAGLELARERAGLDHYEVRKWDAWYRHVSLSMFALAVLVAAGGDAPAPAAGGGPGTGTGGGSPVVSPFAGR